MLLNTAKSMYQYFLSEVRKERTIVITPNEWTTLINLVALDWVNTKLPEREFNQKRIDDLESIKVLTDSSQYEMIHCIQKDGVDVNNIFPIPYGVDDYPPYLSGISAAFYYHTVSNVPEEEDGNQTEELFMTGEDIVNSIPGPLLEADFIGGRILRSDKRVIYKQNPYRKPNDSEFIYFEQRGNYIYALPEKSHFNRMILEYYRYPSQIVFDGTVDKVGSFSSVQNKEITDLAVMQYLEKVSDPRIQTQPGVRAMVPK